MVFSLRNRTGWNRLWFVLAVLWWVFIALVAMGDYPRREVIDRQYEYDLEQVTQPESLSDTSRSFSERVDAIRNSTAPANPRPPSQALIDKRRYEAMSKYALAIDQLPHRQRQHLLQAGAAALAPFGVYAILYLLVTVLLWIARGFAAPSPN